MAVLPIIYFENPLLRQKSKRVSSLDGSIQRLIDNMIETMKEKSGVGLAAPQVGNLLRVIIIGIPDEEVRILINPEIIKRSGEQVVKEGCLSLPGYQGELKRSVSVTAKGRDRRGKEIRIKATDLLAQALEHEVDHLNGVLYIDHLESPDKLVKAEPKGEAAEM